MSAEKHLIDSINPPRQGFLSVKLSCSNCIIERAKKIHSVIVKRLTGEQCSSSRRRSAGKIEIRTSR